jgi:hypothetical protein
MKLVDYSIDNACRPGVYQILNTINGKKYVGSAAGKRGLYQRYRDHLSKLKNNKHHNSYLQKSWNKHGHEVFVFEILEFTEKSKVVEKEQKYLDFMTPEYNYCKVAGNTAGIACEDFMAPDAIIEKRKKQSKNISIALKGVPKSNSHAISAGARYFDVYEAITIRKRGRGFSSIYKKGKFIGRWLKRSKCAVDLNLSGGRFIKRCLIGERPQYSGYIFEWV